MRVSQRARRAAVAAVVLAVLAFPACIHTESGHPAPPPAAPDASPLPAWVVGVFTAVVPTDRGREHIRLEIDPSREVRQESRNETSGRRARLRGRVLGPGEAIQYENGALLRLGLRDGILQTFDTRDQRLIEWHRLAGPGGVPLLPVPPAPPPIVPPEIAGSWFAPAVPSAPRLSAQLIIRPDGSVLLVTTDRANGATATVEGMFAHGEIRFRNGARMSVAPANGALKTHDDSNGAMRWQRQ
jgi:hypothetical protein